MHLFWKNVYRIIAYREINLKTLATLADVPYSTITNGKNKGEGQPSVGTAYKIASALNVSMESLMRDTIKIKNERDVLSVENSLPKEKTKLYRRYERIIDALETLPVGTRESIADMILTVAAGGQAAGSEIKKSADKRIYRVRH
ncbi:helix-turn-helix domain-containing protein [Treponema sp. Marseille-Q4523]|uniref:helix-turn-helix domain-containing protein n=1 Tax=Treponema TaxID=157 RepID=UPI0019604AE7|nr:helix-turn-helix domain-containing protein [Treponema sp. Marseille-Q4523]MBM7023335.1 helix-turn-helix domain-containing protein [Treponema sp. Marseille-Q4523]